MLDGIGLTMFLPLIRAVDGGQIALAAEDMGKLSFVLDGIHAVGIEVTLESILILMLFFFTLKGVARFVTQYYQVMLRQRFANKLRLQGIAMLGNYKYTAFAEADSGRIQNSFSGEIGRVTNGYLNYFRTIEYSVVLFVYIILAGLANPKFALIVAAGGLLTNLVFNQVYSRTKVVSKRLTTESHRFQGFLIQTVTSFKYLKATDLIRRYQEKVAKSIVTVELYQRKLGFLSSVSTALREPLVVFIVVVAIFVQVSYFGQSIGLIILSLLFLYRALTSLAAAQATYNSFLSQTGSLDDAECFQEELSAGRERDGQIGFSGLKENIDLNQLSYAHGSDAVLQDFSLRIHKNQTIGIVGASGTGKTTLVNVICGLLETERGMLVIDGIDSCDLKLNEYRSTIGYVTQEPQIFADTIHNNVSFWDPESTRSREKVEKALALAHAAEFVRQLPQGMNTIVGINGLNLSGGQRQRISIARELYREVDILILDEATSALDSQAEVSIQKNIESLKGQYTMLVIAHRLSTIREADAIIHLRDEGRYDIGTFDELIERSASFRETVALQAIA
ncbi:ABC transporter ATP-binding protein [Neolewinella antarctica]|uniref:Subfamily B ATP-binding cassette protein MsbA n=1 Tax=Neolewinella antarctica TaxID=442734 RepID=A0ABX0XA22_9BACT|nr:ABC transporter ATP-binding protein [Neolewinella antarctica]NJC26100.1 subfamily B ATP-binding cassette protein MsbA [Neolewinella antarctica]